MVDYTLTVDSVPVGIPVKVEVNGQAFWELTTAVLTYPENTVIKVTLLRTHPIAEDTELVPYKFIKWENGSTDIKREITLTANQTITATYDVQPYYPVRTHTRRKEKYEGKTDEEIIKLRTLALKEMMVNQQETTTAQQETLEKKVGEYLNKQGLYGIQLHHYRNFSQELYGLTRLFKNETLNKEASLKAQKWKNRGLTQTHLENIAKLFGITLTLT